MFGSEGPQLWLVMSLLMIAGGLIGLGSDDFCWVAVVMLVAGFVLLVVALARLVQTASG